MEQPFDTVKVRLQSLTGPNVPAEYQYRGTLDCVLKTWRAEGLHGFYRGLPMPLFGAAAETACLFTVYQWSQSVIRRQWLHGNKDMEMPEWLLMVLGVAAGTAVTAVLTPVELIKCRVQVLHDDRAGGLFLVIRKVYAASGVRGFFAGWVPTLLREAIGTAAWFATYEQLTRAFKLYRGNPDHLPTLDLLVSGAMLGVAYNLTTFPIDTIKSNIQTTPGGSGRMMATARSIMRAQGVAGLYNGLGVTVLRCLPCNAVIFFTYERVKLAWTHRSAAPQPLSA